MIIAEFTLASPLLRDSLAAAPGVTVEMDAGAEGPPNRLSVVARGQDLDRFENALHTDESVSETAIRGRGPTFGQYDITLSDATTERTTRDWWSELGAEPLSTAGTHRGWEFRMRFPDRATLSTFRDRCRSMDVSFTLHDLYAREEFDDDIAADEFGLADERPTAGDD